MNKKSMICIVCPVGCHLDVIKDEQDQIKVEGNDCPRGILYGKNEYSNPVRTVTSSVWVEGEGATPVSVKTANPVPKAKIPDVLKALKPLRLTPPIHIGDIVLCDVAGTGVDVIATRNMKKI